ncbi:MAG: hypothetical protein DRN49_01480, partial [Thaumarchaeota archaeon]
MLKINLLNPPHARILKFITRGRTPKILGLIAFTWHVYYWFFASGLNYWNIPKYDAAEIASILRGIQ